MTVGGYKAGRETGIRMLHTDLLHGCITDVETDDIVAQTVTLSLEDFLDAKAAETGLPFFIWIFLRLSM